MSTLKSTTIYTLIVVLQSFGFGFLGATFALFYVRQGFSFSDLGLTQAVFRAAIIVGGIGLWLIRRELRLDHLWQTASLLMVVAMLIYSFSTTLPLFCLAEILAGFSVPLFAVSAEPWLVGSLERGGLDGEKCQRAIARAHGLASMLEIPGLIIGGWIASFNLRFPFFVCSFFLIIATLATVLFLTPLKDKKEEAGNNKKAPLPLKILTVSAISGGIYMVSLECFKGSWQVLFSPLVSPALLGVMAASLRIFISGGQWLSGYKHPGARTIASLIALSGVTLGLAGSGGWGGFAALLILEVTLPCSACLTRIYRNTQVEAKQRRRVNAVCSIVEGLMGIGGALAFGFLNDVSLRLSWAVAGATMLAAAVVIWLVGKKGRGTTNRT